MHRDEQSGQPEHQNKRIRQNVFGFGDFSLPQTDGEIDAAADADQHADCHLQDKARKRHGNARQPQRADTVSDENAVDKVVRRVNHQSDNSGNAEACHQL